MTMDRRTWPGVLLTIVAAGLAIPQLEAAAQQQAENHSPEWSATASLFAYFLPDDDDYLQPTVAGDVGALHLEIRHNYEDLDTGSVWLGYNLNSGKDVRVEFTPMLGAVFGNSNGLAPGFDLSVGWKNLSFYSEFEHVFSTDDSADSYLYAWSELSFALGESFSVGVVGQRTRRYDSPRDVQRGLLVSVAVGRGQLSGYVFNPDADPIYVLAAAVGFGAR